MTDASCELCGGRGWEVRLNGGAGTATICTCRRSISIRDRLLAAGVWPAYSDCRRDNWDGPWPEDRLVGFRRDFNTLALLGGTGVGKTHLGVALLAEAVARGEVVLWRDSRDAIERMKDESAGELKRLQGGPRLLMLDDVGAELAGGWGRALSHVVRFRDGNHLPTIITSNLSLDTLDTLEPGLASRLARGVLPLDGLDRRTAPKRSGRER
ncbi:MAG TPA: ATP-binding protein [Terriglobia bacterium]|nr:ATP-binding protein [Terriglobia bacterium]